MNGVLNPIDDRRRCIAALFW